MIEWSAKKCNCVKRDKSVDVLHVNWVFVCFVLVAGIKTMGSGPQQWNTGANVCDFYLSWKFLGDFNRQYGHIYE